VKNRDRIMELLAPQHAPEMFALIDRNRKHLRSWLPWVDGVRAVEDTEAFIELTAEQNNSGRGAHFGVFHNETLAGVAGFHPIDWANRSGEIGYWLGTEFTGRGLIAFSAAALLEKGFREYDLNRIEIRCAAENIRSIAVAKRLGMVYEGKLREEEWLYDRFVDHAVYSILKKEYSFSTDGSLGQDSIGRSADWNK